MIVIVTLQIRVLGVRKMISKRQAERLKARGTGALGVGGSC